MRGQTPIETLKQLLPQCLLPDQIRIGLRLARALEQARGGRAAAPPVDRWLAEAQSSIKTREMRAAAAGHLAYPAELPITARKDDIVEAIRKNPVVVVAGETGSGKTTQLPKMCLEAGLGLRARIGCTQPRRVAALSISRRIAEELGVEWGRHVGCKIRFSDHSRPETAVKVMTDGILLAEIQGDPMLAEYEAIIIDEAHERSINIDFLLGHLQHVLAKRDDLKLIVTSATIDTEIFARAFDDAPVIEVSGRLYPVEVRYRPIDEAAEEEGEITYIDAAVAAAGEALDEGAAGDLLIFMPSERDIRETCDLLQARQKDRLEVVPLFGRLTAAEQQKIFTPGRKRRAVVATNIAETSLTVPRIRYVIDTGLARISRYHPGTRSRRLPVEPVAQSSANQRKGRCGRVADGVCIRLYAEADFEARRPYVEPEIQRCNLADVILRMKAFRLGEIETFPFLDPPVPAAIRGAFDLLQEIGALDPQRALTPLGADLARLPVDPAIGRMILEADREGALTEVLVIAAGLSIQDPRERPLDQKDQAETAHRRFQHPESDFLTLLNIWNAYHDTWDSLKTQSQLRKFCKSHFLSFVRMREWRDIHAQIEEALEDLGGFRWNDRPADYACIHRSILTGLWGHVGQRHERNIYRLAGNRQVMVFPGSSLFAKPAPPKTRNQATQKEQAPTTNQGQPAWMVAGELVETTRPFARTVAGIEPEWGIELAAHLVRADHLDPRWDAKTGRVLATERVTLRGLVLRERAVPYLKVNPNDATDLFIRKALVEEELEGPYEFLEHNRKLREKLELWQTRLPHRVIPDLDEAMFEFYAQRVQKVGSTHDLNHFLKGQRNPKLYLCATENDLLGSTGAAKFDRAAFPDTIMTGGHSVPVSYAYAPGEERDGVTLHLSVPLAELVDADKLDWLVPGLREERVFQLLQRLPKSLRRSLMPLNAAARAIVEAVDPSAPSYPAAMSHFVRQRYGVDIPPDGWPVKDLPPHLRARFEIVGRDSRSLATGRNLGELRDRVAASAETAGADAWKAATQRWERYGVSKWDFGDLPERCPVTEIGGLPLHAYPGLQWENGEVNLRLFRKAEDAAAASREGIPRLAERALGKELGWLQKDLRDLNPLKPLYVTLGPAEELTETAWENLREHLFIPAEAPTLTAANFDAYVAGVRQRIPGLARQMFERVSAILNRRQEALVCPRPLANMAQEVEAIVPRQFLRHIPFEQLRHVPRHLQALLIRAERAAVNPAKHAEKARQVLPYAQAARDFRAKPVTTREARDKIRHFLWMVEEFKVSVFAQELGTAFPISAKRLEEALAALRK